MSKKIQIIDYEVHDVRFPTSDEGDGSDAMNCGPKNAPDYSAAFVILKTDYSSHCQQHQQSATTTSGENNTNNNNNNNCLYGEGFTFTIGRGNELCCAAIHALVPLVMGLNLEDIAQDFGKFSRHMTQGDTHLSWVGGKGILHLATAAIINAVFDLYARFLNKPLWRVLCDMSPEELVKCIDFRYITDALTPEEALEMLKKNEPTKKERIAVVEKSGIPCYTTSAGWLGYPSEKIRRLSQEAVKNGFNHIKIKVGRDVEDDIRRCKIIREEIGDDRHLMLDANAVWDVEESISWMKKLAFAKPLWIEEPTSADDVLGHARIARALEPLGIAVATGEHCQNRVMFKQMMQADSLKYCQADCCRLAGVSEVLAVILMAAKFKDKFLVCFHAGGVGLCNLIQHLSIFDFVCASATTEGRVQEWVHHLHEHWHNPPRLIDGKPAYSAPTAAGYSGDIKRDSLKKYSFPDGEIWVERRKKQKEEEAEKKSI